LGWAPPASGLQFTEPPDLPSVLCKQGNRVLEYRKISTGKSKKKPLWIGDYPSNLGITIERVFILYYNSSGNLHPVIYSLYAGTRDNKGITVFIENSKHMFEYHSKLEAEHPYQSAWWNGYYGKTHGVLLR